MHEYSRSSLHKMKIVPHVFGQRGGINLLQHAKQLLENDRKSIRINESQCPKLIKALRSATAENNWIVLSWHYHFSSLSNLFINQKSRVAIKNKRFLEHETTTSFNDIIDTFRLSLKIYKMNMDIN